ncbi:MAG: hypothetical protein NVSMB53_18430 [Gemmatimonadaceae bacterium]
MLSRRPREHGWLFDGKVDGTFCRAVWTSGEGRKAVASLAIHDGDEAVRSDADLQPRGRFELATGL